VRLVLPETESSAAVAGVPDPLGVSSEEIKSSSWAREEAGRSMGVTARDTLADNAARRSSRSLRSEASCCRFFSSSASARDHNSTRTLASSLTPAFGHGDALFRSCTRTANLEAMPQQKATRWKAKAAPATSAPRRRSGRPTKALKLQGRLASLKPTVTNEVPRIDLSKEIGDPSSDEDIINDWVEQEDACVYALYVTALKPTSTAISPCPAARKGLRRPSSRNPLPVQAPKKTAARAMRNLQRKASKGL
jgi:hypothetical protein